jgi:hypothetical protein
LRTDIDERTLAGFVSEHVIAVVLIHASGQIDEDRLVSLSEVCERTAMPCALAAIDSTKSPGICAQFTVVQTPYLLIFRDRVVLYAEPASPTAVGLEELLTRVQKLNMDNVRQAIEVERQSRDALLMRRVCPTARSGPARSGK